MKNTKHKIHRLLLGKKIFVQTVALLIFIYRQFSKDKNTVLLLLCDYFHSSTCNPASTALLEMGFPQQKSDLSSLFLSI